jgi:hypothetical protein
LFELLTFWPPQNGVADADADARAIVAISATSKAKSKGPLFILSCICLLLLDYGGRAREIRCPSEYHRI